MIQYADACTQPCPLLVVGRVVPSFVLGLLPCFPCRGCLPHTPVTLWHHGAFSRWVRSGIVRLNAPWHQSAAGVAVGSSCALGLVAYLCDGHALVGACPHRGLLRSDRARLAIPIAHHGPEGSGCVVVSSFDTVSVKGVVHFTVGLVDCELCVTTNLVAAHDLHFAELANLIVPRQQIR